MEPLNIVWIRISHTIARSRHHSRVFVRDFGHRDPIRPKDEIDQPGIFPGWEVPAMGDGRSSAFRL